MYKEFTCRKCDEEQTQELVEHGAFAHTTCWSCGDTEWYMIERESNLTPEQEKFWENWMESQRIWKETNGNKYCTEREFKDFHNARVAKLKEDELKRIK